MKVKHVTYWNPKNLRSFATRTGASHLACYTHGYADFCMSAWAAPDTLARHAAICTSTLRLDVRGCTRRTCGPGRDCPRLLPIGVGSRADTPHLVVLASSPVRLPLCSLHPTVSTVFHPPQWAHRDGRVRVEDRGRGVRMRTPACATLIPYASPLQPHFTQSPGPIAPGPQSEWLYSYPMAEWLVELQGDPAELGELADQFISPRLKVCKEGEHYYLRSSEEFNKSMDAGAVHARATELLFLMSGIANLYAGAGETVTPGVVIWEHDDGTRNRFIQLETLATERVRAKARLEGTKAIDPTVCESWLSLARQDPDVLDALYFFQEGITWWSFRKAYEVIETEFGNQETKVAKELSVDVEQLRTFKKWTHHYVHGARQAPPDVDRHPPLSAVQADSFLRDLIKKWIQRKKHVKKLTADP